MDGVLHVKILTLGDTSSKVSVGGSEGTLHVDRCWMKQMVVNMEVVLMDFTVSWYEGEFHIHALHSKGAKLFMKPCNMRGDVTVTEVFAGLSGWTSVIDKMGLSTSLVIEKDHDTAMCSAKKLQAPMMNANQYMQAVLEGQRIPIAVIWDDVTAASTWMAVGLANVGLVVGSPPCPPWSKAAHAKGLDVAEGLCFQQFLEWTALITMPLVIVENVPGIVKHADFRIMVQRIERLGMTLALSGTFNSKYILPVNRDRWIGTFVHSAVLLDANRVQLANSISFTNQSFKAVATSPSIDVVDVTHVHMSGEERHELSVQPHALEAMSNIAFAPQWLKDKAGGFSPQELLQGRVIELDEQYKGFMAMYGSQHLLDTKLLESKGLHTVIMQDDTGYRYFSPWEMLTTMGYTPDTVLSDDITKAWRMSGNGITSAHVWLAIYKTHVMLGSNSPFSPMLDVCQQIQELRSRAIHLSEYVAVKIDGYWVLQPHGDCMDDEGGLDEKDPKKRRCSDDSIAPTIPATVAFTVDQPGGTKMFQSAPEFLQINEPRKIASAWSSDVGIIVVLQHVEKHWIMVVNGTVGDKVADLIIRGLPHAKPLHFQSFQIQGVDAEWTSTINRAATHTIVFVPVSQNITISVPRIENDIVVQADVTWTVRTLLAYAACQLQCNPDALVIQRDQYAMKDDEYLGYYECTQFKMAFKACMPGYVGWDRAAQDIPDPGLKPDTPAHRRLVARHPLRKVIRTGTYLPDCTISQAMQLMFPDLVASVTWTSFYQGKIVNNKTRLSEIEDFTVQWETFRPMPPTTVHKSDYNMPIDSSGNQVCYALGGVRLTIRSPVKVKTAEMWCPKHATMAQIAASFLQQTQANVSMLCEAGPRVIDPDTTVEQLDTNDVISFRICPLLGGGKHDALKTKLKTLLVGKGVPEDAVGDRVTSLLGKVPIDHIAKYKDNSDDDFWIKLKDDASDAKFRLITPAELKQFQQNQRKNKAGASNETKPKKQAKGSNSGPDLSAVRIDMSHFKADDEPVVQLEASRFGPDQTGLLVVPCQDAHRYISQMVKSADPLAVLIIGPEANRYGQVFRMPAHLANGEPVVISASLRQCGDIPIQFTLSLPMVKVEQMQSTVVEVCIMKEYVGQWSDVAQPLNYIGIHVPVLRGNNLLGAWSIKAFAGTKPVSHNQADHVHGYVHVADSLLGQVLQRSGSAGVFLVPKTDDRRRDPRFVAFQVPAKSLADVMARADSIAESLGVIRMGDAFGIRCKREDASQVRQCLSPESAYVEQIAAGSDETMYVLRNVPQVSREELSNALVRTGWQAHALRSQGVGRWLVASKAEPQATHIIINSNIVLIEKMNKKQTEGGVHLVASEVKISTVVDQQQGLVTTSTTSRFAEFRSQVEEQIAAAVDQKLAVANERIAQLASSLEQVQAQSAAAQKNLAHDVSMVREEQSFTRNKLVEVENSISVSNQSVLTQMQAMFQTMEQNMRNLVQGDSEKRARVGDMPKSDPFSKSN